MNENEMKINSLNKQKHGYSFQTKLDNYLKGYRHKGIESLPQTQIFLLQYLCNPML